MNPYEPPNSNPVDSTYISLIRSEVQTAGHAVRMMLAVLLAIFLLFALFILVIAVLFATS